MIRLTRLSRSLRGSIAALCTLALAGAGVSLPASLAQADTYTPISGSGSTWSQNALDQWRRNAASNYGMTVNYSGSGSSAGRRDYISGTVDFAISEIPFQLHPTDGSQPEDPSNRPYAYMPIVAGGTSLMYNLKIGGKRVTNLRLSGDVVTKIFTGRITNWSDPAIKADNPGLSMPNKSITVVARSDGSGTTAQFTKWMDAQYQSLWRTVSAGGFTSQFPTVAGFKYQSGSSGVAGYVAQAYADGAITYVEYSYALKAGFPVAKLLNKAGYYIEPTAKSVAVAMLKARINTDQNSPDYLTQILDGVYNTTDPRAYPMSSYSYMIVPTQVKYVFTADKGKTLGTFSRYMLCEGQQQAAALGYSPLPMNLVKAGFSQIVRIPGADTSAFDPAKCNNPTFKAGDNPDNPSSNELARTTPQPAACDKQGPTQCTTGTAGASGTSTAVTGSGSGGSSTGTDTTGGTASGTDGSSTGSGGNGSGSGGGALAAASPFTLASDPWGGAQSLMLAVGLLFLAAVLIPPYLIRRRAAAGERGDAGN